MSKLVKTKTVEKLSPVKIKISMTTREGEQDIGTLNWTGEMWELDGNDLDILTDLFDSGMSYGGKVYTVKDHKLYLPLTRSRYTGIFFDIVK